ncbi:MAG TPA: hypothetical protein VFN74_10030 [Chloroflexota bacterium]|nr:hypothetical protein [Chloroflexota bacterium]
MIDRPPLPWGTVAAVASGAVLLLAFFHLRAGGTVGPVVALIIAAALAVTALALRLRRPRRALTPSRAAPLPPRAGLPEAPPPPLGAGVQRVATELARAALTQLAAPAASVLVERAGRLTAAGSAGDWAAARRGLKDLAGPGLYDPSSDGGDPPEFPLDPRNDWLPRILALYGRPVSMERWQELSDAPSPLLPLAALAASGVGVAEPLARGARLTALCVVAQRADAGRYSDDELNRLHRLAREAARSLADALGS